MTRIGTLLQGTLFHFFNDINTRQGTLLRFLVSFFNKLDTRHGTMLIFLVSFFNELDTRQGTMLMIHLSRPIRVCEFEEVLIRWENNALEGIHSKESIREIWFQCPQYIMHNITELIVN